MRRDHGQEAIPPEEISPPNTLKSCSYNQHTDALKLSFSVVFLYQKATGKTGHWSPSSPDHFLRQEVTYHQELGSIQATGQCHAVWCLKGYRARGVTCHHWALPRKEQLSQTEDTFSRPVWLISWFTSKQGLTKGSVEQKLFGMLNWRTLRGL